ncbi:MAG TPA: VWA domain-containing protein [Thermoanaerobaculia bacterium]|nr:VWA domain-containing protein [Thermoanaerobaculia bacterium]
MQRFAAALALLVLALPFSANAQEKPSFQEQIDVNVALIDAVVTDNRGNQILGLTKDDFIVKENGVVQPVESVDYFTSRKLLSDREENAPFPVERVREDRYLIFFFDKPSDNRLFSDLAVARNDVRKFIDEQMTANDRVAIAGHDFRLKIYSDFTNDKAALKKALTASGAFGNGLSQAPAGDGVSILRNLAAKRLKNETGTVYEALDALADATRTIKARKNVVLFSPGIADIGEEERDGVLTTRSQYFDPMIRSLNAANVTVYGVQLNRQALLTEPLFHQRLEEITNATNGEYFRFNTSFRTAIDRVEKAAAGYYLITYRAPHAKSEHGFQKVDVSLRDPSLRVTARSGYDLGS